MTNATQEKPSKARKPRPSVYDEIFNYMGVLQWSIIKANALLDRGEMTIQTIKVEKHIQGALGITGGEHPTRPMDLTRPCIMLELPRGLGNLIIDGNNRIRKAHAQGVAELPCIVLTPEQEKSIRLRGCPWHILNKKD